MKKTLISTLALLMAALGAKAQRNSFPYCECKGTNKN